MKMIMSKVLNLNSMNNRQSLKNMKRTYATILQGVKLAKNIKEEVKEEVRKIQENNPLFHPKLVAIAIGNNPASKIYLSKKMEAAEYCGISFDRISLPLDTNEKKLVNMIEDLNQDTSINGIIVQLPLPAHMGEIRVCNSVSPDKDVDGFTQTNLGRLMQNTDSSSLVPCTALAVKKIVQDLGNRQRLKLNLLLF